MSAGYEIPWADPITEHIDKVRRTLDDLIEQTVRLGNRSVDPETDEVRDLISHRVCEEIQVMKAPVERALKKLIREHPMGDWLVEAKTAGSRVATVLSVIRNPHRFPSQQCSNGCHLLPTFDAGDPCPCYTTPKKGCDPEPCDGRIQEPRRGTGCRALWHMFGLYPVKTEDGERLARHRDGVQSSHNARAKTAILMPQGIAQQFYMQGSRYAEPYYEHKHRLEEERPEWAQGRIETTARVIAAKAWLGDLLMEWKERTPLDQYADCRDESEVPRGVLAGAGV